MPFEMREYVPAKARVCGPVLLDGIFMDRLYDKTKEAAHPSKVKSVDKAGLRQLYLRLWENHIKVAFDGMSNPVSSEIPSQWKAVRPGRGLRVEAGTVTFTK